jgi:squalene-hopene/tetraprenyl-beta-curcumene cyclase
MKASHLLTAAVVGAVAGTALLAGCRKQETPAPKPAVAIAAPVRAEAEAALAKGAKFLLSKQLPDGSWMQHPAITSLAAMALAQAPGAKTDPAIKPAIDRALDFVVKFAKPDGSIWNDKTDDYPNYSTSIATLALAELNRPQDQKILRGARDFLLGSQFKDVPSSDASYGGIGYGKAKRPDLSNTQWALEALRATEHLDREPLSKDPVKAKEADLAWERVAQFLSRCQNLKESNDQTWVATDPENKGGFVYMPGDSKAGKVDPEGDTLRSYGSMTYAGLKSMLYAKVSKDDPRVKAAAEWIRRNYTFDENPGMKDAGLYYYLHTGSKALDALGEGSFTDAKGVKHDWRSELIHSLVIRQDADGKWINKNARWMESVPELTTCYSMLSLGVALGGAAR